MQQYDGITENGIEYITTLYERRTDYRTIVQDMDLMYPSYRQVMSGKGPVQSYGIGTRNVSRSVLSADRVIAKYETLRDRKLNMENGRKMRKTFGIVPRDI